MIWRYKWYKWCQWLWSSCLPPVNKLQGHKLQLPLRRVCWLLLSTFNFVLMIIMFDAIEKSFLLGGSVGVPQDVFVHHGGYRKSSKRNHGTSWSLLRPLECKVKFHKQNTLPSLIHHLRPYFLHCWAQYRKEEQAPPSLLRAGLRSQVCSSCEPGKGQNMALFNYTTLEWGEWFEALWQKNCQHCDFSLFKCLDKILAKWQNLCKFQMLLQEISSVCCRRFLSWTLRVHFTFQKFNHCCMFSVFKTLIL